MFITKKEKQAIGNRIGNPGPYIIVMKDMFMIIEYLKCTRYSGPA